MHCFDPWSLGWAWFVYNVMGHCSHIVIPTWQWIAKLRPLIVHVNKDIEKFVAARHYTAPVFKQTCAKSFEKAINWAMMLVTLHLIYAWILKPLLKCHICLISHYSPDRVRAFNSFSCLLKRRKFSLYRKWTSSGKCHLNGTFVYGTSRPSCHFQHAFQMLCEYNVEFVFRFLFRKITTLKITKITIPKKI